MGRILSYYDLCDIPYGHDTIDKDLDFSEFMTEEEREESELKRLEREEGERRKREEEAWLIGQEEKRRKEEEEVNQRKARVRMKEEEAGKPRDTTDIFREINRKRKSSVRPKSAHGNPSKINQLQVESKRERVTSDVRVMYARRGSDDISNLAGQNITIEQASVSNAMEDWDTTASPVSASQLSNIFSNFNFNFKDTKSTYTNKQSCLFFKEFGWIFHNKDQGHNRLV